VSGAASTRGDLHSVFTQCSKCETIFRLSPEVLRAAGGQVRCGRCGEVFNAVARLGEEPREFVGGEPSLHLKPRANTTPQPPADASPDESPADESPTDELPTDEAADE